MQYVRLGSSGLRISALGVGCMTYGLPASRPWMLDEAASKPFFRHAIELGINFFDTANVYSQGASEMVTGRWLREFAARDEVIVATKVGIATGAGAGEKGLSRKHIMAQIDASLRRLGMDYVDLYQIHRYDDETPIEETLEALDDIIRSGKIRYIGASSMYAWQFCKLLAVSERNGWARFVSMQPQYNLVYREEEREMLPLCYAEKIGVLPWSPLARGFLAGERKAPGEGSTVRARTDLHSPKLLYFRAGDFAVREALRGLAVARGVSNAQIALAWVCGNPAVSAPLIGATQLHHLDDAVAALDLELTHAERQKLESPYQSKPILDHS